MSSQAAIFFDRDNTLNADPRGYIGNPDDLVLLPFAREILSLARAAGFLLFLVTNQSGVSRGYFSQEDLNLVQVRLMELLGGNPFCDVCVSLGTPDLPDAYRKPSPRFLDESIQRYNLVREASWVVGDSICDAELAHNACVNAILVDSPRQEPGFEDRIETLQKNFSSDRFFYRVRDLRAAWEVIAAAASGPQR